jgi:hypothetical protein
LVEAKDLNEVDIVLGTTYERVAQLSHHDWLYKRTADA